MNVIIFSKDRASQLEFFLRSMFLRFEKVENCNITVIYTYSNNEYKEGYDIIVSEYPTLKWVKESSFKKDVISSINKDECFTVFFTDDDIFVSKFSYDSPIFSEFNNKDVLCVSLRLNPKLKYSYAFDKSITVLPKFTGAFNRFNYTRASGDYGYPMSLDGHIFRTGDILPIIHNSNFTNPNTLESKMDSNRIKKTNMCCFNKSVIINNPSNIVQKTFKNRHGESNTSDINRDFLNDMRISSSCLGFVKQDRVHDLLPIVSKKYVSVIIPSFNRYHLLMNAINSVKNQTYKDFEIIVIDDQSTDKSYAKTNWSDLGVKYYRTDIKGVVSARNLGIEKARFNTVAFLDDDDSWLQDKLEFQMKYHVEHKMTSTEAFYSEKDEIYNPKSKYNLYLKEKYGEDIKTKLGKYISNTVTLSDIKKHNVLILSSVIVDKETIKKCGCFFRDPICKWEDWSTWIKILEDIGHCYFIEKPLIFYNNSPRKQLSQRR